MFSAITTDFRKIVKSILYPKYENKQYCTYLKNAYLECIKNNNNEYKPCYDIYEFINSINCYDLSSKLIQSNINNKI